MENISDLAGLRSFWFIRSLCVRVFVCTLRTLRLAHCQITITLTPCRHRIERRGNNDSSKWFLNAQTELKWRLKKHIKQKRGTENRVTKSICALRDSRCFCFVYFAAMLKIVKEKKSWWGRDDTIVGMSMDVEQHVLRCLILVAKKTVSETAILLGRWNILYYYDIEKMNYFVGLNDE